MNPHTQDITLLLQQLRGGNALAADALMSVVYDELRRVAQSFLRRERPDHTLQATALVNEVYLRLVRENDIDWQGRAHFFAVASQVMRRILIDHARVARAQKRPQPGARVELTDSLAWAENRADELVALDEALERLAALDPRQARVVELRFFGGMSREEIAAVLGVSLGTVKRDWLLAKAWLEREVRVALGL